MFRFLLFTPNRRACMAYGTNAAKHRWASATGNFCDIALCLICKHEFKRLLPKGACPNVVFPKEAYLEGLSVPDDAAF